MKYCSEQHGKDETGAQVQSINQSINQSITTLVPHAPLDDESRLLFNAPQLHGTQRNQHTCMTLSIMVRHKGHNKLNAQHPK